MARQKDVDVPDRLAVWTHRFQNDTDFACPTRRVLVKRNDGGQDVSQEREAWDGLLRMPAGRRSVVEFEPCDFPIKDLWSCGKSVFCSCLAMIFAGARRPNTGAIKLNHSGHFFEAQPAIVVGVGRMKTRHRRASSRRRAVVGFVAVDASRRRRSVAAGADGTTMRLVKFNHSQQL